MDAPLHRDVTPATALVLGVTSHRDLVPEDVPHLRAVLAEAIGGLRAAFPDLSLMLLSPLAEGGDQLAAEVALSFGARLFVPLPMPLELYLQDFTNNEAAMRLRWLLGQATSVELALAGDIDAMHTPGPWRDRQYLAAGLHVANHCHLMLALWDGSEEGGTGGTSEIVRYYLGGPLPGARRATDNLRQMLAGDDDSLVLHVPVRRRSSLPFGDEAGPPRWLTSAGSRPFADGMPPDYRRIFERMQVFERDRRDAATQFPASPSEDPVVASLAVVDAMAVHNQRLMTAAMRVIHGLAVVMGLSFLLYSDLGAPDWMLWVFLVFFMVGLLVSIAANRLDWHRKYIDYRALAEGLRVQAFWRRAGLLVEGDPEFAHDNFLQKQDVELGWIRNVMRQLGLTPLPPVDDPAHAVEQVIEDWVGRPGESGQLAYYGRKAALRARHHHRTQLLGEVCLWIGIAISLLLAVGHGLLSASVRNVMVTTMGALSLFAAVREAYAYRKADKELVKQYRFMQRIYTNARIALDAARTTRERREILRALGEAALAEHAEWALMHRDRPIEHGKP
jgi:membrane protein YdbS with pleckstrin-like domain